jgi:hypothetical protein
MKTLLLVATALAVGCGLSCTEMYVPSGFSVGFEASSWPAGHYEIELSGDVEALCSVELPAEDPNPSEPCDVDGVELSTEQHALAWLAVRDPLPEYLHVTVLLDGVQLASQVFEPRYDVMEPNGPGCGETISASDSMLLD